jgi:hypothetical protein
MNQLKLFETGQTVQKCHCGRCGALCKVDPVAGSKAKMLKHSKQPKGLCVNCAVHDFLRNTYPVNMLLAQAGPRGLALTHIQEQFAGIMKSAGSDAMPDEIDWQAIIDNWDLPFANKVKSSPMNPMNEEDLAREPENNKKRIEMLRRQMDDPRTPEQRMEDAEKEIVEKIIPLLRSEENENS